MKLEVINIEGKKIDSVEVSDKIFSAEVNKKLVKSIIDWQLNNAKPRVAKTKQRNEIIGSTAKIYAQKGTGGARHSSRKAPIFVGGGIAHGPKGAVYKIKKLNKKVKKVGLLQLLSQKHKIKLLHVVEDFKKEIKKTKEMNSILIKFDAKNSLIILDRNSKEKIEKSIRNIPNVKSTDVNHFSSFDIVKYKKLIFTESSIKELEKRYL